MSDLKDVLTTDRVKKATGDIPQVHFAESDFIKTVVVIVPRYAAIKLVCHSLFYMPWRCFLSQLLLAVVWKANFSSRTSFLMMTAWS